MSAVKAVSDFMEGYIPWEGATEEDVARNMFFWQNEIYSSYCGRDLNMSFDDLKDDDRKAWLEEAKNKIAATRK